MIFFRIEGLPPSYNKHFNINYNFREVSLSQEAHQFKRRVKFNVPEYDFPKECRFRMELLYFGDFYYKNGTNRKIDLQNMDKLLIDAVFEKLGRDDSQLWELTQRKFQKKKPCTIIMIESLPCQSSEVTKEVNS